MSHTENTAQPIADVSAPCRNCGLGCAPSKCIYSAADVSAPTDERLAEQYSDMLRKICFEYSAGGYNSEGLMLPHVADAKIRWIIEDVRTASLWQAARAAAPVSGPSDA